MKTQTLNGVPYSVNETQVYAYGSSVLLGTNEKTLSVLADWETKAADYLADYRRKLKEATAAAMEKAKQQYQ
jgi:hypothetical protein